MFQSFSKDGIVFVRVTGTTPLDCIPRAAIFDGPAMTAFGAGNVGLWLVDPLAAVAKLLVPTESELRSVQGKCGQSWIESTR